MADQDKKRFYWLKLRKDFFKDHRITIVESMPNGKDYILFYLKLLCESTSHEGKLRFSETIPYNEQMLSTITNTNLDIVRSAIKVFSELEMMEILDDGTIYMCEVEKMIGSETGQTIRKNEAKLIKNKCFGKSLVKNTLEIELEKEIEKEIDNKRFAKPTYEEVKAYCDERHNNVDAQTFIDFYESKGWKVGRNPMKDWKACVRTWEKNSNKNERISFKGIEEHQVIDVSKENIECELSNILNGRK